MLDRSGETRILEMTKIRSTSYNYRAGTDKIIDFIAHKDANCCHNSAEFNSMEFGTLICGIGIIEVQSNSCITISI